jgi:hypothetical protein
MDGFEGYVGIGIWDDQLVKDALLMVLFALLTVFALVFRMNYRLFVKMIRDVFFLKERQSLFDHITGNEFIFKHLMAFQALFLCSLSLFTIGRSYGYITHPDISTNLVVILVFFIIVCLLYGFKRMVYGLIGRIFAEPDKYKFWKTNYHAITGFWGVLLYLPIFWSTFIRGYVHVPALLFALLYVVYRFLVIYKTIRIFHIRGSGFLYIILYLCAQEILPLIVLYEGMGYLYNIIEKSALWH